MVGSFSSALTATWDGASSSSSSGAWHVKPKENTRLKVKSFFGVVVVKGMRGFLRGMFYY